MRKSMSPEALRILISQFFLLSSKKLAWSYGITCTVISMAFLFFTEARSGSVKQTIKTEFNLSASMGKLVLPGAPLDFVRFLKSYFTVFILVIAHYDAESIRIFNGRDGIDIYWPRNQFFK